MNEKDMLQKIKDDANSVTPPASLAPDAVERMLQEQKEKQKKIMPMPAAKKKKRRNAAIRYGSLAAVFVLALTAMWQSRRIAKYGKSGEPEALALAVAETESGAVTELETAAETDAATVPETAAENAPAAQDSTAAPRYTEVFSYAESPEAIYEALREQFYQEYSDMDTGYGLSDGITFYSGSQNLKTAEIAVEDSAAATENGRMQETDFSGTNLQEADVDEGDIVKTDGSYIYILRRDMSLAILQVEENGAAAQLVSVTPVSVQADGSIHEMYLDGDRLYIITSEYISSLESEGDVYYPNTMRQVRLQTFDISDRSNPALTGTVTQEGSYETSRKNGGFVYLFTSYYPDIQDTYDNSVIMPRLNGTEASASDVFLPESLSSSTYLVISSVDTAQPEEIFDSKILVSCATDYYVSAENIYIANTQYDGGQPRTEITKFHYEDGEIIGVAAGSVKGYLNNSFSMNEYEGNLRVVSTYTGDEYNAVRDMASQITGTYYEQNWEEHNALYVLDDMLQQIGAIEGLADGETIRSARFFGDVGYFVTFRQTDPLFSVDLSDPANPRILGELKISGFSSYLHFYGENLLLGIGYEADEETGITSGLKLSMFDISDPANVTEVHRFVIPGITWCPAIEDYKSILVQPQKNIIGFYCDNRYLVFSYDEEEGFTSELTYDFYSDMLVGQAEYNTMRGLYIEDTLYLAGNTFLVSFDMKNGFEKTDVMAF